VNRTSRTQQGVPRPGHHRSPGSDVHVASGFRSNDHKRSRRAALPLFP
jgi:hypothetical protein